MKLSKISDEVQSRLVSIVIDNEYATSKSNQQSMGDDFEAYIDLFDSLRTEKDYDWQSDISIPEFASHMLTQAALDAGSYFMTRDFVEVYVMDERDAFIAAAEANKELINRTLNRRDLYYYQKYLRAKLLNHLDGKVYAKCWWERKTVSDVSDVDVTVDDDGNMSFEVHTEDKAIKDCFNFEPLDPRNVFTDNTYTYSIQDKNWVIIRSEVTLNDLENVKERNGYFNLDALKDKKPGDTETKQDTLDRNPDVYERVQNTVDEYFDRFERYGKFWSKNGRPGIDADGNVLPGAVLAETVMTFVDNVLIGFHETPYRSKDGLPYRPIIRGLCYIHPIVDGGTGDAKYARPIQIAINDTFNMSNDRTMLATMPTMVGRRGAIDNSDSIYFEPNHIMMVDDPSDIREIQISDNIGAAMNQFGILMAKMQEVTSIYPTTMGNLPAMSSTTATAVAGAEAQTNKRTAYKSMTFENTFLADLYWMIGQMTYQFALPETGEKLMGDKVFDFDPALDYYYRPLSQAIENEHTKRVKSEKWVRILQSVVQLQHPDAPKMVNYILTKIATLDGDEFANFANKFLMNEQQPIQQGAPSGTPEAGPAAEPVSNQYQVPQSTIETSLRGIGGGGY